MLEIAIGQLASEQLTTSNQQLSIHDTDLITIKIWSEYKYGNCDKWILEQIEKHRDNYNFLKRSIIPLRVLALLYF